MSRAKLKVFTLRVCGHPVDRNPEFVNESKVAYRSQTLLQLCETFELGDVVFVVNGELVDRSEWDSIVVRPNDVIDAVPDVGWLWALATWLFWNIGLPLILSFGLSYLGGELFGSDAQETDGGFESTNFAWTPRTTQREGLVRPRIYGESMIHGNITASWTDTEDDNEILYAIIDHGDGPVEGLGANILYINDQPAGNYSDVVVVERLGTIPQVVMSGFEKTKIEYTLNWDLTSAGGEKTFTTPNNFFDDLEYTIAFPSGLTEIDEEDGDVGNFGVLIEVEISERGLSSWTTVQYETIVRATRDAVYINFKLSEQPSGYTFFCERGKQYDLKFKRITGTGGSNVIADSVVKSVREVVDTPFTHPGRSMLGVKALATGQLHGVSPDFKCIRKGRLVQVYDGDSWSLEYSSLTAWVVYDILTQPIITGTGDSGAPFTVARYDGIDPDNLDTAFFYEWAQLCDYQVSDGKGGTESQFVCNYNLDTERSVFAIAYELAQIARANLYWEGNIVTGWLDAEVSTVTDLITVDNIVAKSWKNSWGGKADRAGSVTVFYRDGENGFERTSIKISNALAGSYKSAISIEALGETRRSGAIRYGHFLMQQNALLKNMNSFDVLKDAMRWKLGDVVRVQCMKPGWGEGYRVLDIESGGRTVDLDRNVENVQAGDTVYIRCYDAIEEEVNNSSYTVDSVDGSTITVTTDLDPVPSRHSILAATTTLPVATTPVFRRIIDLKQRPDGFYEVTVQTYDAALYGASPPVDNPNTTPVWAAPAKSQALTIRPINWTSLVSLIKNSVPLLGGALSISWRGEFADPPEDPETNWVYRNTTDGIVYIYDASSGAGWEEMVYDGDDGESGTPGDNGLSVFITYHDNEADDPPDTPTGDGTSDGWHTDVTEDVVWFSQKVAEDADSGTWGTPLRISGTAIWSEVIDDGNKPEDGADVTPNFPSDEYLLGHWSLDNGVARDHSGNDDHGTLSGAPSVVSHAVVGGGLSFDGVDDHVKGLNITLAPKASSISWWMIKDSDTRATIFVNVPNSSHSMIEYVNGNQIYVEANPNSIWHEYFDCGAVDADDGDWHHYVFVYDAAATYLYVDGVLRDTETANSSVEDTLFCYFGLQSTYGSKFDGDLTEIRTYSKALSASEVKALYLWPGGNPKIEQSPNALAKATPSEIPWVLNCLWSQDSGGTIYWESRDGINPIQLAFRGNVYDITEDSTSDDYVYWDPDYTTVFSHNDNISVALGPDNWLLCGVVSGVAYPVTPIQYIHAGVILAGTIRAESYAELRQTMAWNGEDSLDATHPYTFDFKLPSETTEIISAKLSFKIKDFRAYSTGAASGGGQTSGDGGSNSLDSTGSSDISSLTVTGGTSGTTNTDAAEAGSYTDYESLGSHDHEMPSHNHDVSGETENKDGDGSHYHDISQYDMTVTNEDPGDTYNTDLGNHRHALTGTSHYHEQNTHVHFIGSGIVGHTHNLTIPDHTHSVAAHVHDMVYNIYEENNSVNVDFHVDDGAGFGAQIGSYNAGQLDIDISSYLTVGTAWKSVRFDADARCRLVVLLEIKVDITA